MIRSYIIENMLQLYMQIVKDDLLNVNTDVCNDYEPEMIFLVVYNNLVHLTKFVTIFWESE